MFKATLWAPSYPILAARHVEASRGFSALLAKVALPARYEVYSALVEPNSYHCYSCYCSCSRNLLTRQILNAM